MLQNIIYRVSDNAGYSGTTSGSPFLWETTLIGNGNTTATMDVDLLDTNKQYFWRVRGENGWCIGTYTADQTFYKEGVDDPVLLNNPGSPIDECNTNVNFDWQAAQNATRYQFQIGKDVNFGNMEYDTVIAGLSTSYNFTVYGTYYWRVRAWDEQAMVESNGCQGPWSETRIVNMRHIYHVLDNAFT